MFDPDFVGLNNFVWWFGVVEDRQDPLNLGRCKIRCFGWHTESVNQISTEDLPWAQPVVPYGSKIVQPPTEGTMVFGFFADGEDAHFPIILGTVPGIPAELREIGTGFTDPLTVEQKRATAMPRKLDTGKSQLQKNTRGVKIVDEPPSRYPKYLNEPSTSRLARPVRGEKDGKFDGIDSASIANTTIDFQRKTRVTNVATSAASSWDEAYPTYAAKFPYNNVTETESGHAFELDDTFGHERVQLSHRTGSTLEFANTGATKIKSMSSRQDLTMGDSRNYVNGNKYETIDGDYYLKVGGKLRIHAGSIEIVSGSSTAISAVKGMDINGGAGLSASALQVGISGVMASLSGVKTDVNGDMAVSMNGGLVQVNGKASVKIKSDGIIGQYAQGLHNRQGVESVNSCIPDPVPDIPPNPPDPKLASSTLGATSVGGNPLDSQAI